MKVSKLNATKIDFYQFVMSLTNILPLDTGVYVFAYSDESKNIKTFYIQNNEREGEVLDYITL